MHAPSPLRPPELMAPAGDWEALRAAVANGADAVYFGLPRFNARHRATNFAPDDLPRIMAYLHSHNVRGFLTFNTLIFSDELEAAADYIRQIAAAGVDAVIVQDLGLARLIHAMAPTLPIHGSTQMTLTEPRGIEFVRRLGASRVVAARELSIADLAKIRQATDAEIEVFVHGALCVAYSGQCLTSESIGGRSANRGQCAQACRLPYDLVVDGEVMDLGDKAYLLSPQDLAAYDRVDDLARLGITSLKIEGRLKSAHYVAATTQTYRRAIDAAANAQKLALTPAQRADLEQTFSRGFTHGFLDGVNHQELVAARFPKARGTRIGTVAGLTDHSILIDLDESLLPQRGAGILPAQGSARPGRPRHAEHSPALLKPGDGVVFDEGHPEQDEQGGRVFAVRQVGGQRIEIELGRGDVNLRALSVGALVWKTDDPALKKRLEHSFSRDTVVRRSPLDAVVYAHVGQRLTLTLTDRARGHSASASWDKVLEPAQKFPLAESMVREQVGRLGDTPFELAGLRIDAVGGPMVPKSVLNDLRRQAVMGLIEQRERASRHAVAEEDVLGALRSATGGPAARSASQGEIAGETPAPLQAEQPTAPALHVLVRTLDQLEAVLAHRGEVRPATIYCDFEDIRRYKDAVSQCRSANQAVALATLRIVKPGEEGFLRQIASCAPDALLVRNLAAVAFFSEQCPHLPLIGDYALNIANELTARLFAEQGLVRFVPSYDLNWKQLAAMVQRGDASRFECVIHQHMPMFHMEHCVFAHTLSDGKDYRDCGRPCEQHAVDLRDRVGQAHPLIPDVGCRNTVFNAQAQSAMEYIPRMTALGIGHFRLELLRERPEEVPGLLDRYAQVIAGRIDPRRTLKSLRVLNQLGVTPGTLVHD